MKTALLLFGCIACASQGEHQSSRWPDHRTREEKRIADLEAQVAELQVRVNTLEHPVSLPATEKVTEAAIDQKMIAEAIRDVKPQLVACGDKAPTAKGTVKIHAKVDPDATVTVTVETSPDPALGECVADVVRGAKFPKTLAGGAFAYPFVY